MTIGKPIDHIAHELSERPNGVMCLSCAVFIPDPQVPLPDPAPVWTDPADMRRLRPVTSTRGWSADRDDSDPIKLRALYARMDALLSRGPGEVQAWGEGDYLSVLTEVGAVWSKIRKIQRGN